MFKEQIPTNTENDLIDGSDVSEGNLQLIIIKLSLQFHS